MKISTAAADPAAKPQAESKNSNAKKKSWFLISSEEDQLTDRSSRAGALCGRSAAGAELLSRVVFFFPQDYITRPDEEAMGGISGGVNTQQGDNRLAQLLLVPVHYTTTREAPKDCNLEAK